MDKDALLGALRAKFNDIKDDPSPSNLPSVIVPLADFRAIMEFLYKEPSLHFDYPMCQTAVDWPEQNKIVSTYHLYSMDQKHKIVVKCELERAKPEIPTVSDLWQGCEWFERETFDMFGIVFEGHPDLRRILMTDDWVGFPLRKDYRDSRIAGKPF